MTFYINNIKLVDSDEIVLNSISQQIAAQFKIKNLDYTYYYFSIKVKQDCKKKIIYLSQEIYIKKLLKQYKIKNCIAVSNLIILNLKIINQAVKDKKFIKKY